MLSEKPNIFLLVMDCQRHDHLGCYGYEAPTSPNIDEIAEESTIFLNNISSAGHSISSHASLFSGKYLTSHGCHLSHEFMARDFPTLPEVLNGEGYDTVAFSNNAWVRDDETGIARGFRWFHDIVKLREHGDKGSLYTVQMVKWWIDHNYDGTKPFFVFVLCTEVHTPCWPPHPFRKQFLPPGVTDEKAKETHLETHRKPVREWSEDEKDILKGLADGETATLDNRMGMIFSYLRDKEILDDTLLIITADHGDGYGEHPHGWGHGNIYQPAIHVPLIIRYPKLFPKGSEVKRITQTLDLFPTIVEILGVENEKLWGELQGYSILSALTDKPKRSFAVSERAKPLQSFERALRGDPDCDFRHRNKWMKSIQDLEYKYIWSSDGKDELYHIREDRYEQHNLIDDVPEKAGKMRKKLEKFLLTLPPRDYGDRLRNHAFKGVIAENVERLKAWGFYREITDQPSSRF